MNLHGPPRNWLPTRHLTQTSAPIAKRKAEGDDWPLWEENSRHTKILWRQWERLFLVRGVLHQRFYELEGHGWCHQLVVPKGRREDLMQKLHAGAMAWCVALPYTVTSSGNQSCLIVGCYFTKWLKCYPIPDQKANTIAGKLVFEVVARCGAFREVHSDQGTNFGSQVVAEVCQLFGIHKTTPYHPRSRFIQRSFRTLGSSRETRREWDELVPFILLSYRVTPQASTWVMPNMLMLGRQTRLPIQAIYGAPLEPEPEGKTVSEYVAALQAGLRVAFGQARISLQRAAIHQRHDYHDKVQRGEYQAEELVWNIM